MIGVSLSEILYVEEESRGSEMGAGPYKVWLGYLVRQMATIRTSIRSLLYSYEYGSCGQRVPCTWTRDAGPGWIDRFII